MKEPWVIETACLGMRPFTENDVEELHSALDNDEFVRAAHEYFGTPEVKEELEKSLLEGSGHAPWAVVMKATGELAGFFGMRPVVEEGERRLKALYIMRSKRFEQGYASEAMQAARRFIERVFVRASAPCERAPSSAPKSGLLENLSREEEELLDEYRGAIAATRAALAQEASPANPPAGFRVHGSIVKQFHGLNALSFTFSLY
ncbi:GNAT family N-acetyltransferase [uncultured Slackia sp.]|uniref:GNAT family N-acetyltransferase n=1 Tax=uncultured Slackia sp. TaxID=665903 RepID=UPI00260CADFB|nr:GNAT family N-acetyltransferase [uncultured Slackia sp.]